MVPTSYIAALLLATVTSHAAPWSRPQRNCLSGDSALSVATKYGELISAYSDAAADAILSTNFTDFSAGVNALINACPQGEAAKTLPLLDPTFTSREAFKTGQGQQPLINFEILNLWHNCDSVTIQWKSTNSAPGDNVKPIIGLIVMETIEAPAESLNPFLIDTVYSEFDSGSWLQNLAAAGICGPSSDVVGAPAPVPSHSAAAPAAPAAVSTAVAPTASPTSWRSSDGASASGAPSSWTPEVPSNRTRNSWNPTASHFRA